MPDPLYDLVQNVVDGQPRDADVKPTGSAGTGGGTTSTLTTTFGSAYVTAVSYDSPVPDGYTNPVNSGDPSKPGGALEVNSVYQTGGNVGSSNNGVATGSAPIAVRRYAVVGNVIT